MTGFSDTASFELGNSRLRLKDGLKFTLHHTNDETPWYMIEDEVSGNYYRVGIAEYTLLSLLDGKRTLSNALALTASSLKSTTLDENEGARICHFVIESGLAHSAASQSSERVQARKDKIDQGLWARRIHPIAIQVPLFQPDSLLTAANRLLGWLISWPGFLAWLAVCGYGFLELAMHWSEFSSERIQTFSQHDFFWIAGTWLLLKVAHEFAHGLTCKRFGGRVGLCGFVLLLFVPLPFVDVTSSWSFEDRSRRMLTSAAGMMVELLLAAIGVLIWVRADAGPLRFHMGNLILAASLHTLLFNANPLMRFDGYYILSDWLRLPNLYQHARQYVVAISKQAFCGVPAKTPAMPRLALFIKFYGIASLIWSSLLVVSLLVAAINLFEGVGFAIAILAGLLWIGIPSFRLIKYLIRGSKLEKPNPLRFVFVTSMMISGLWIFGKVIPSPILVQAPIVIDYQHLQVVHAETPGFIREIRVQSGKAVEPGEILMVLENPDLNAEFEMNLIQVTESELKCRILQSMGNISGWMLEQEDLHALRVKQNELRSMLGNLIIRANTAGEVVTSNLSILLDTYVASGTELISIAQGNDKKAIALVNQNDARYLMASLSRNVFIDLWGSIHGSIRGRLVEIDPRARDELPHEAFSSAHGGPLAVLPRAMETEPQRTSLPAHAIATSQRNSPWKLARPHVLVRIDLPSTDGASLRAGQSGTAYIAARKESLGPFLLARASQWFSDKIQRTHGF